MATLRLWPSEAKGCCQVMEKTMKDLDRRHFLGLAAGAAALASGVSEALPLQAFPSGRRSGVLRQTKIRSDIGIHSAEIPALMQSDFRADHLYLDFGSWQFRMPLGVAALAARMKSKADFLLEMFWKNPEETFTLPGRIWSNPDGVWVASKSDVPFWMNRDDILWVSE